MMKAAALLAIWSMLSNLGRAQEDGHFVLGGPRLTIGDKAPPLRVQEFVRGQPVQPFKPGTTYVLEFWKVGCPPCRAAIPHLNELQKQYPAVVFISVGVYTSTADSIAYVKRSGNQMEYRVAVDRLPAGKDPYTQGSMVQSWLEPAQQNGVPASHLRNLHQALPKCREAVGSQEGEIAMNSNAAALRKLVFRRAPISALDALEVFVPTGAPHDAELDALLRKAVQSRWYPVEGGEQGLILYRGGPFNEARFTLRRGAWDHAHCAICRRHIAVNALGWISVDPSSTILCEECHEDIAPKSKDSSDSQPEH